MVRILHFRNCRGITTLTGPETYLLDLLKGCDPDRFLLDLTCAVRPKGGGSFVERLTEIEAPFRAVKVPHCLSVRDAGDVRQRLKSDSIDILHTHDSRSNVLGWLSLRGASIPWITFAHGWVNWKRTLSKDRLYAALEAMTVARAHHVIVASAHMRSDLLRRGIPESRITRIPYGIDTHRFSPGPPDPRVRAELGIPEDTFLVGTIGRIHPWKGHQYLVDAVPRILAHRPHAHFLLVGDIAFESHRPFKENLEARVKSLGLRERFIFAGTRMDTPRLLRTMDLFVLPSIREPFGIVMLEAQACGRPVIGTRVDGVPETVEEGATALLVKPANPAALTEAVAALMGDRVKCAAMGIAGRKHVEDNFSVPAMVCKTQELYENVYARHRKKRVAQSRKQ